MHDENSDPTLWWNKIDSMGEEEIEMLPFGHLKKYGSMLNKIVEHHQIEKMNQSRDFEGRWKSI